MNEGVTPILFDHFNELPKQIKGLQPDLIVRDGRNSEGWQVEELRPFCKTIIHFDDFGEGGQACDCVLLALYQEVKDYLPAHYIGGSFVLPCQMPINISIIYLIVKHLKIRLISLLLSRMGTSII